MLHHVLIGDNERVLVIRKGRFAEILGPGEKWLFGRGFDLQLQGPRSRLHRRLGRLHREPGA